MNTQRLVIATGLMLCQACSTTPIGGVASLSTSQLCAHYGSALRGSGSATQATAREALQQRSVSISAREEQSIAKETVYVGMSECALYASWGIPSRQNRTITAAGTNIQHVWAGYSGRYISTRSNYAYTTNGTVTAIQTP